MSRTRPYWNVPADSRRAQLCDTALFACVIAFILLLLNPSWWAILPLALAGAFAALSIAIREASIAEALKIELKLERAEYEVTRAHLPTLRGLGVPRDIRIALRAQVGQRMKGVEFIDVLVKAVGRDRIKPYVQLILEYTECHSEPPKKKAEEKKSGEKSDEAATSMDQPLPEPAATA